VPDRFSTATRLRALGAEAQARVYRATGRAPRLPRPSRPEGRPPTSARPRRGRLTGRAALLAAVLVALVVALAYPARQYVSQRSEIADQRRQAQQTRDRLRELREQKARWQDPDYVRTQAREHLHSVLPGEVGLSVPYATPSAGVTPTSPPAP
jgi:cell division protein FtsB